VLGATVALTSLEIARPAFGAGAGRSSMVASATVSSGPLIILGVVVVIAVVLGFAFVVTSRRKKPPTQCAEQRSAFESAERALSYWQAAVTHLQSVEHHAGTSSDDGRGAEPGAYRYGQTADMSVQEFEALVKKAVDGRDAASKYRDQCQIDLIVCMGQSPSTAALPTPGMSAYERFESKVEHDNSASRMENS